VNQHLHPAVRDIAMVGAVSAAAGAVIFGLGLSVDPGDPLENLVAFLAGTAIATSLSMPRGLKGLNQIVDELQPAPEEPVDRGLSPAVWWSIPILAVLVVVAALLSVPIALCGAVLLATGGWELFQAVWLRRFEELNDLRLLYRPVYRWAGTNGRVIGRGWFDPANFVESN
jgi:hypothetical protein